MRGESRLRKRDLLAGMCVGLGLLPGCMTQQPSVDRALAANRHAAGFDAETSEGYCLRCPDVVDVTVDGRPDLSGKRAVGQDGRINVLAGDRVRIEGRTPADSVRLVAAEANMQPYQVQVHVAEFNSQQIYLFGPGVGVQRAVPYEGPETVVELLQRTGAVSTGAAPNNIYIVRPRVAEGQPPEVFPIHLRAILSKKNEQSNVRLQPYDQVYIGETWQSSLAKCIPPCLRPLYDSLCGLRRPNAAAKPTGTTLTSNQLPDREVHAPEN
jgi:protein involved in polysaccharide export with SLBB domain